MSRKFSKKWEYPVLDPITDIYWFKWQAISHLDLYTNANGSGSNTFYTQALEMSTGTTSGSECMVNKNPYAVPGVVNWDKPYIFDREFRAIFPLRIENDTNQKGGFGVGNTYDNNGREVSAWIKDNELFLRTADGSNINLVSFGTFTASVNYEILLKFIPNTEATMRVVDISNGSLIGEVKSGSNLPNSAGGWTKLMSFYLTNTAAEDKIVRIPMYDLVIERKW